jgi:hypothetical protein
MPQLISTLVSHPMGRRRDHNAACVTLLLQRCCNTANTMNTPSVVREIVTRTVQEQGVPDVLLHDSHAR